MLACGIAGRSTSGVPNLDRRRLGAALPSDARLRNTGGGLASPRGGSGRVGTVTKSAPALPSKPAATQAPSGAHLLGPVHAHLASARAWLATQLCAAHRCCRHRAAGRFDAEVSAAAPTGELRFVWVGLGCTNLQGGPRARSRTRRTRRRGRRCRRTRGAGRHRRRRQSRSSRQAPPNRAAAGQQRPPALALQTACDMAINR